MKFVDAIDFREQASVHLIPIIYDEIAHLDSLEAADFMTIFITRMYDCGEVDELTYREWLKDIKDQCVNKQWAVPIN